MHGWRQREFRKLAILLLLAFVASFCATKPSALRYRLADADGTVDLKDPAYADLIAGYKRFFNVISRPERARYADTRQLAVNLEAKPVTWHNYRSLNAIALAYYHLYTHSNRWPGGRKAFHDAMFPAVLLALPWHAYQARKDAGLRGAILDFFEDVSGREGMVRGKNARLLASNLAILGNRETDAGRRKRLRRLAANLRARIVEEQRGR